MAGTVSTFFGHRAAFAGDLFGRWWPAPRALASVSIGGARALAKSSELGRVRANDLHGTLGLGLAFVPSQDRLGLLTQVALSLARVSFEVAPIADAVARAGNTWALVGSAGVDSWARAGAFRFSLGFAGLVPITPARATAGGVAITSLAGIGAELHSNVLMHDASNDCILMQGVLS